MCQTHNLSIFDTIVDLHSRGFYYDLCIVNDKLFCVQQKYFLDDDEFNILEIYRFPYDDKLLRGTVIYGIESLQNLMKGILLNSLKGDSMAIPPIIIKKAISGFS